MGKSFGAGQLRYVIKIQKATTSQDGFGGEVRTWVDESSCVRAQVVPLNMNEQFSDPRFVSDERKQFNIRYRSGLKPTYRIIYNDETYNIESIIDTDERRRKLEIIGTRVNT